MANTETWRANAVVIYDSRNAGGSAVLQARRKQYCEVGSRLLYSRSHMSLELIIGSKSLPTPGNRAVVLGKGARFAGFGFTPSGKEITCSPDTVDKGY